LTDDIVIASVTYLGASLLGPLALQIRSIIAPFAKAAKRLAENHPGCRLFFAGSL
jgi:hypothetical protein